MIRSVSAFEVTVWDQITAIGAFVGAFATTAAVIVALVLGAKDRRAAQESVEQQLAAQGAARSREHELDLLLQLQAQVARYLAYRNMPQQGEADEMIRGILLAIRDPAGLPATRLAFAPAEPTFSELPVFDNGQDAGTDRRQSALLQAPREVAAEIRRVALG